MILRLLIAVMLLGGAAQACSCRPIDVRKAVADADVVFRGTVIDIHDAKRDVLTDILQPRKHIVVFRVNRVWKGDIGETFAISAQEVAPITQIRAAANCMGWWDDAAVGDELLVYARHTPETDEYTTSICYRTKLAKRSAQDLQELGPGKPPTDNGQRTAPTP